MDVSSASLRVLRQIAESGSFTAAAAQLGYTQSAVSRQAAALERSTGATLFERRPDGVRLTPAGLTMLRHGRTILDAVAAADQELTGQAPRTETVRLGVFMSAGATLLPAVFRRLATASPHISVTTREGTTPGLTRALRAGSIDLALLSSRPPYRPPDAESPRLQLETLGDVRLLVAAPAAGVFAGRSEIGVDELIDAPRLVDETAPSRGRPRCHHGPAYLARVMPPGVALLRVDGAPPEIRRLLVAGLPGAPSPAVRSVTRAIASALAG